MIKFCLITITIVVVSFFLEICLYPKWRNHKNESKILSKADTTALFDTSNNYKVAIRKNNNDLSIDYIFEYNEGIVKLLLKKIKEVSFYE